MSAKRKRVKKVGAGFLSKLLILLLAAGLLWQLCSLQSNLQAAEEERQTVEAQVNAKEQENEALSQEIADGGSEEQMKEIARNELGMVEAGERVYYNVNN